MRDGERRVDRLQRQLKVVGERGVLREKPHAVMHLVCGTAAGAMEVH